MHPRGHSCEKGNPIDVIRNCKWNESSTTVRIRTWIVEAIEFATGVLNLKTDWHSC